MVSGEQLEAFFKMTTQKVIAVGPPAVRFCLDQKWINKELGVLFQDRIEPIVFGPSFDLVSL